MGELSNAENLKRKQSQEFVLIDKNPDWILSDMDWSKSVIEVEAAIIDSTWTWKY